MMKKNPSTSIQSAAQSKVSIVVPVYGVEKYLQKCIDSLVSQTFKDIEIILVDDGSKDGSGEICDQNALRNPDLIKVIHQENAGLGGARNTGIKAAQSKYLMFVDSDDYLRIDAVELAYKAISTQDVDMVSFGIYFVNDSGRVIKNIYDGDIFDTKLNASDHKEILLGSPSVWNKIYKTNLFEEHNLWFTPRAWHEDVRMTSKMLTAVKDVVYIKDYLYYYVQRNDSITHNANVERNKEMLEAIEDVLDYYETNGIFDKFHDELEYLAIINMYNSASARVATVDPHNHLLEKFSNYLVTNFPNYKKNKYLSEFSGRQKVLFFLVERKMYGLLKTVSNIRAKLDNRK